MAKALRMDLAVKTSSEEQIIIEKYKQEKGMVRLSKVLQQYISQKEQSLR